MSEYKNVQPASIPDHFTCSGIVVTAEPRELQEVRRIIEALDGLRVHQEDGASGRLIVTQEASSDAEQAEGLLRLQRLPGVLAADLVYYHREEPEAAGSDPDRKLGVTK